MKLIEPSVELIEQEPGIEGIYKQIEVAARLCYKSEDRITEDSAKKFVDMLIKNEHCYTGESEILTINGWIKWKDYKGQKVAVVNKDLSFKGFEIPNKIIKYDYNGKYYDFPSLGIKVTEGHKMFGVHRTSSNNFYNNNNYYLFECNALYKDQNGRIKTQGERMFKTPRHCTKPLYTNPYMELVGFWLGDGCYHCSTNELKFHLKKTRKIKYLQNLAMQLGYEFVIKNNNNYVIRHSKIGEFFRNNYYKDNNKYINIENSLSSVDAHSVIVGLINSDGGHCINTNTITYTSTSKSIIDWLCVYAPIAGYTISYKGEINLNSTSINRKPIYKILLLATNYTINNDSRNKDSKVIISKECNTVYCVTVSTGIIIVRGENGIVTICGNCAMLEHGTVYMEVPIEHWREDEHEWVYMFPDKCPWISLDCDGDWMYITTNFRHILNGDVGETLMKQYLCGPTKNHEKRYTLKFTTSIGITRELTRHRHMSFACESTRYVNYKNKGLEFVKPYWFDNFNKSCDKNGYRKDGTTDMFDSRDFIDLLDSCEKTYLCAIIAGAKPQEAREVLPLCTKSEIIMTGFESDWKDFFKLRCDKAAHPDMQIIANKAKELLKF